MPAGDMSDLFGNPLGCPARVCNLDFLYRRAIVDELFLLDDVSQFVGNNLLSVGCVG
jgi:hypothetical protein